MAELLREKIEAIDRGSYHIPRCEVLKILDEFAERGATTREPDGWTWAEPVDVRNAPKPVNITLRDKQREGMHPVYIGEAPQGATTPAATAGTQVGEGEANWERTGTISGDLRAMIPKLRKIRRSDVDFNPLGLANLMSQAAAALEWAARAEGSPQPASPRSDYICDEPDCDGYCGCPHPGGDTLTPETPPLSQVVGDLERMVGFLCGERAFANVWFGERMDGERGEFWWRKPLRERFEAVKRAALVGEEAP